MALLATASSLLHKYSLVPKRNTPRSSLLFLIEMASQAEIEHPKKAFGWAARDPSGLLSPFNFSRSETGEKDVAFKVLYCGICHSDLHMVKNEWGFSTYPLVPGHELVGVVIEVGSKVEKFKVGDKVGVGCLVDSCRTCQNCSENLENYCPQYTLTYGAKHRDGTITYGGYSDSMVAEEHFCIALRYFALDKPGLHVGVVGLGGLGHMAVKFAKAFGAKVTVISTSPNKKKEAIQHLGADSFLISRDQDQMQAAMGTLDGVETLTRMKETQEMIDFAAEHYVKPDIEVIPVDYTFGWAARDTLGLLSPFNFSIRKTGEKDVRFKVLYCGICDSDLHMVKNEWAFCTYPVVPGHEIVGVVTEVGNQVEKFKVGDKVGVGGMVDSCRSCQNCDDNLEIYCPKYTFTFGAKHKDGTTTYGGFSDSMVADEHFVVRIPDGLPLDAAAPLLCAGITVYSPLRYFALDKPGIHVGVVGLAGLGHMAVKFAKAFGAKVTVITNKYFTQQKEGSNTKSWS
ncbi:putative mannitol dehydrogenase [Glycine soja]